MSLQLTIPDEVERALRLPEPVRETVLLRELAVVLYEKGVLSFGKARALAQASKWQFDDLLNERNVVRHYNENNLNEDLAYGSQ